MGVGATFLTSKSFDKPQLIDILKNSIDKVPTNDKIFLENKVDLQIYRMYI